MIHIPRTLIAFVLAGGVTLIPAAGMTLAASAAGTTAPRHQGIRAIFNLNHIASVEGVTPAVLKQDLAAGETLFQIAGSKYASPSALATALLAPIKQKLDSAVTSNKITPAQESQRYTALLNKVTTLVVTPHPERALGQAQANRAGTRHGAAIGKSTLMQTMVTTCATTPGALKAAIQAGGKSPLAICQATKPTVTQSELATALTDAVKARLDAAATAGKISAAQESQRLTRLQARINTWVITPLPARGAQGKA